MSTLKERDPINTTDKKQLYNARHKLRAKERGPRNETTDSTFYGSNWPVQLVLSDIINMGL
jgi:hypothetical protein